MRAWTGPGEVKSAFARRVSAFGEELEKEMGREPDAM